MRTLPTLALAASALGSPALSRAAEPPVVRNETDPPFEERLEREAYPTAAGERREYLVYFPRRYDLDRERRWPLLLFLHGNGERGDGREDLDWVGVHGPLFEAWVQKRDLPFVIVAPQLPLFGLDRTIAYIADRDPSSIPRRLDDGVPPRPAEFPTPEPMSGATPAAELPFGPEGPPKGWPLIEDELSTVLDQVVSRHRIDRDRVYLTGLSYGGFGAWYLASRHPGRFAAVAPVVGWGHPELMAPLAAAKLPVWVFAGGRDPVVPVRHFFAGVNELERLGHDGVRFTIHEDAGHDAWKRIYAGEDLYAWLLSHRRGGV